MLDNLTQRLSKVVKTLRGQARLTEENIQEAMREVRMALLEADVALPVVKDFVAKVREKAVGQEVIGSLTPGQALVGVVHDELKAMLEVDTRYRALEYKIKIIQESLEVIVDLSKSKRETVLEITIILIIAFEAILSVIKWTN